MIEFATAILALDLFTLQDGILFIEGVNQDYHEQVAKLLEYVVKLGKHTIKGKLWDCEEKGK